MKNKTLVGVAAAAVIAAPLAASPAYAASAPSNLSFEEPAALTLTDGYYLLERGDTSLTGWTVDGAGVDAVDNALWQAHEGSHSIDMNAYGPGSISQDIPTVPGQVYEVSFWMSGNPGAALGLKTMDVSASGAPMQKYTYDTAAAQNTPTDMKYKREVYTFAAAVLSTTLTFASTTTATDPAYFGGTRAAWGPVIDDLVVTTAPEVAKNHVWHTWTGGPVTSAPSVADAGWHATNGDPQSKVHKYENHTEGVPYFVANKGNKGGGSWFVWLDTNA